MIRAAVLSTATLLALFPGAATAQVTLQFQFPEGRITTQQSTTTVDQTLTINGQPIPTKSVQTSRATTQVGAARPDGTIPVTHTIDAIKAQLSLPGGIELAIDSDDPQKPEGEQPQLAAIRETIRALDGVHYTILIGKDGSVTGVEGLGEAIPGNLDPQVTAALKQRLAPETLTEEYRQEYGIFPPEPVQPGETWQRTDTMNLGDGQTLTFERTYSYVGTVDRDGRTLDQVRLTATGVTYAMDNPDSPLQVKDSNLKVDSSEGQMLFDRTAGLVAETTNSTHITGTLTLSAGGQEVPAQLDLTIATTTAQKPAAP